MTAAAEIYHRTQKRCTNAARKLKERGKLGAIRTQYFELRDEQRRAERVRPSERDHGRIAEIVMERTHLLARVLAIGTFDRVARAWALDEARAMKGEG